MGLTEIKTSGIADDAVTSAKIADNAVGLAAMAGGTDGQIITYDASGDPVAVGPGTDGQVLTSTGAGSPPAFEAIPASAVTALNNATANELVTVGSTTTELDAEANLTYDGTTLKVGGDSGESGTWHLETNNASGDGNVIIAGSTGAKLQLSDTGSSEKFVLAANGDCNVYSYKDDDDIIFNATTSSTTAEKFRIYANGNVKINDGDLVIGTAGHGIDFSATTDGPSQGSETLDDYERGTYTPEGLAWNGSAWANVTFDAISARYGRYTKIGGYVHVQGYLNNFHVNSAHDNQLAGISLPFTPITATGMFGVGVTTHSTCFVTAGYTTFFTSSTGYAQMYSMKENLADYNTWLGTSGRYIMFQASYMTD